MKKIEEMEYYEIEKLIFSKSPDKFTLKELEEISNRIWLLGKDYKNENYFHLISKEIDHRYSMRMNNISLFVAVIAAIASIIALFK